MKTTLPLVSKINQFIFAALLFALLSINHANATSYYAIANGNWNLNTTWSLTSGGAAVGVGVWPLAGDIVYISEGTTARTVTIPAGYSAACADIYIGAASGTAATLALAAATSSLSVSGNVTIYGPTGAATRAINADGGTINIGGNLELNNGQTAAYGNRICRMAINTGTVTVSGNLVFNNIATSSNNQVQLQMSTGAGTFNLAGAFTIVNAHGTLTAGTTSTFNFNGSAAGQTIPVGVAAIVYNNINVNNTHVSGAILSAAATANNVTGNISVQSGSLNNGGYAITLASTKNFSVANGATFNLTGTSTMVSVSGGGTKTFGPTSTVNYAGTNQAVTAETYGNIIFSNGGTKTLPISTLAVAGNWTNNSAALNAGTGSVLVQGATLQTIGGTCSTSFFNLTLNNAAGALLGINTSVTNALTLTSGILSTGAFTLDVANTAPSVISGNSASNYINGNLQRGIAAGANTYDFPIGTATTYTPVSLSFTEGTEDGSLKVFTTNGDHPNIGTSSFTPEKTVNRHWTCTIVSGLATANYDATFNWVSADQDEAFDYNYAYVQKYTAGAWSHPAMGTVLSTSAQVTGVSGFSDFQVGNDGCTNPPAAAISGSGTICAGDAVSVRVDLSGSPNWTYTWSDGTNSGTVSNVSTTPSYFTVYPTENTTYTITSVHDAVGCTGTTSGSATYFTGPVISFPVLSACPGNLISIPVTVRSFTDVGAISLIMNYDHSVMTYDSYTNNSGMIDILYSDVSGTTGIVRFSGITVSSYTLEDGDTLITLKFNYIGGTTNLTWDDSGDGTLCELSTGAPDFIPYCDIPGTSYYLEGSVTETSLVADFIADTLLPPKFTPVQLTDLSTGDVISWEWSFNRTSVEFLSGDEHSQNPIVQFTNGGNYTVTLVVQNQFCTATEEKIAYIRAGRPGYWIGETSDNWFTETNWDDYLVPNASEDVVIQTVEPGHFNPHVPGNLITSVHCANIILEGEPVLVVDGALIINPGTAVIVKGAVTLVIGEP